MPTLVPDTETFKPAELIPEAEKPITLVPEGEAQPIKHESMYDRMYHGSVVFRALTDASRHAGKQFEGDIGFAPDSEATKAMQAAGLFKPDSKDYGPPQQAVSEGLLKGAGAAGDLTLRTIQAGVYGTSAFASRLLNEAYSEFSGEKMPSQYQMDKGTNEFAEAMNLALMGGGSANPAAPLSRARLGRDGIMRQEAVGRLPEPADFHTAAHGVGEIAGKIEDAAKPEAIAGKIRAIYEETGIHPAEVLADAADDPALAAHLASDTPLLPPKYSGVDPKAMAAKVVEDARKAGRPIEMIPGVSDEFNYLLRSTMEWPKTPTALEIESGAASGPTRSARFGQHISRVIDQLGLGNVVEDLQRQLFPMAMRNASMDARATAKDYANAMRTSRARGGWIDDALVKEFTEEERTRMWNAIDADSVALQKGEKATNVAGLAPKERGVAVALRDQSEMAHQDMHEAGGRLGWLPSYAPRMIVDEFGGSEGSGFGKALDRLGTNVRTKTSQMLGREHLTVEQTEAAAKAKLGEGAKVVRDIRTLNLATTRMNDATAGRKLIQSIKELSDSSGAENVVSAIPKGREADYFTLDHPAFKEWQRTPPARNEKGQFQAVTDAEGKPAFEQKPLYVSKQFEGPLRAVLTTESPLWYQAVMDLKSKSMTTLMFSPLMHNQVIAGRALPEVNGNVHALAGLYFRGNQLRSDPAFMLRAIGDGLTPIGKNGAQFDINSIAGLTKMEPGRSWTSQVVGFAPSMIDESLGKTVKGGVDAAGKLVHETMLWDRIADLQMGLYEHKMKDGIANGLAPDAASKMAAHFANRYVGALPPESVSEGLRRFLNVSLFSRSYTSGTVGSMKDMFVGLPRDVLAQIERDQGMQEALKTRSYAERKAIAFVAKDVAMFYTINSLTQTALEALASDKETPEDDRNFAIRFGARLANKALSPLESMNPVRTIADVPQAAMAVGSAVKGLFSNDNEPGKEHKVLWGYQADGTAIYVKLPPGKTGEDMYGFMNQPGQTAYNKMSPGLRAMVDLAQNRDYAGRHIYNPYPDTAVDKLKIAGMWGWYFAKAQLPSEVIGSAVELATNKDATEADRDMNIKRIVGGITGFTFSKGYPGGPFEGALAQVKQVNKFQVEQAMPDIKKAIKEGRTGDAMQMMDEVKMDPHYQRFTIDTTLNPSLQGYKRSAQRLLMTMPEDQRGQIMKFMEKQ